MNVPIIKSTATKAVEKTLLVAKTMENLCNNCGTNIRIYLQDSQPIFNSLYPLMKIKIFIFSETRYDINDDFNFIWETTRSNRP